MPANNSPLRHGGNSQTILSRAQPAGSGNSPTMNSLEARIRQKQSERLRAGYATEHNYASSSSKAVGIADLGQSIGSDNKGGDTYNRSMKPKHQPESQFQRLTQQLTQVDQRLQDGKQFTDTKFNQLNAQMNEI